ncbi:MAG: translocation/assembly module TamB domain-containing protein [Pseudomonadota bacterium]
MRRFLLTAALIATPVAAQDTQEERDRGFLVGLIEDNLEAPGLSVRLDGFEGALSSEATLERLSVSDEQGTWLVLENVVLDWNRSALLRGRLEVTELSAQLIRVDRAPLPPEGVEALPDAGASGFALPDLPVSIDIDQLQAQRIELGEALMGQALALSLTASAELAGGSGQVELEAQRLDGTEGVFSIAAAYAAASEDLTLDLDIREAPGGLAASLLQLPGTPGIELTVEGAGPLDDFAADIVLASDGEPRVSGAITLAGVETGRRFDVDLGGDMTALLAPEYQPFFGDEVRLEAEGTILAEGGTDLDTMRVETEALTLTGAIRIGADGWPSFIDVGGVIASADGAPVVLPTADAARLQRADLSIALDSSVSDDFTLTALVEGYDGDGARLDRATVDATGTLSRQGNVVDAADAVFETALTGLDLNDPDLVRAVGDAVSLTGDVTWAADAPVRIGDLTLRGDGYGLAGSVEIGREEAGLTISPDLQARFEDIARLSGLAGRDLAGAADVLVAGDLQPVAGTFDLAIEGATRDLGVGIDQADALLGGTTDLTLRARRTVDGTFLDTLDVQNPQLSLTANAALVDQDALEAGQTGRAVVEARIADGTTVDPRLDGPVALSADVTQDATGAWSGAVSGTAPQGVTLSAEGRLTGDLPDVTFQAAVPNLDAFAPGVPGGATLDGRAFAANGVWSVDVQATGPWELTAQVSGPVTGDAARIAFEARLPDLSDPVPALDILAGPVALDGVLARTGEVWSVETDVAAPADITLRARGPVTGGRARLDIAATVPEIGTFVPGIDGTLSVDATLAQQGADWLAEVVANGPAGTRITADTTLTASPLRVDFTAAAPNLSALVPAVPGSLDVSGHARQVEAGWDVDVAGTGPYDAMFDASLSLADGVPSIAATGQIPQSSALAPQLSGPLNFDVTANQASGHWQVTADVDGAQGLTASVDGIATGPEADLDFDARVANVASFAPGFSGPLQTSGRLFQQAGNWAIDLTASGPLGASLTADGTLTGPAPQANFDLSVPNIAPLVPDIPGPLRVTGTAAQRGGAWALDVDAQGPSGVQADVSGLVQGGGALDLSITGSAPLGLANRILEPQRLSGTAQFDLSVNGPPALNSVSGTVSTSGAAISLPTLRNGFEDIDATVVLNAGRAQIDLGAALQSGGRVTVTGPVTLSAPFDGSLAIGVDVRLEDPALYTTRVVGDVAISGPLAGGALISGGLTIDGAEISVPSSGITAIGAIPELEHVGVPRPVRRTLERAGQLDSDGNGAEGGGGGPVYGLDLFVDAPGRIFIRGRGLDAELGGRLDLAGTTANPIAAGGFSLVRGRLDLLSQRFDLDEGAITFQGDFVPNIRLVANTSTDALDASIIIEGPADEIEVRFESTPEVPEEEILAQIFFGRNLSELSAFQALQLANSVAVLAGRGSGGVLNNIRSSAGLDDLDVTTNDDGVVGVRAGRALTENIYTDVLIDQDGGAELSLNLDIREGLTLRGSTNEQSETSLGIFFERDY